MAWTAKTFPPFAAISEEAADSSSKVLTVADLPEYFKEIEVLGIRVELSTTATVGDRLLRIQLLDSTDDDVLLEGVLTTAIPASQSRAVEFTNSHYVFSPFAIGTTHIYQSMPRMFLVEGFKIKIFDSAAIAAAADDMIVHVRGIQV